MQVSLISYFADLKKITDSYDDLKKNCCRVIEKIWNNHYSDVVNIRFLPKNRLEITVLDNDQYEYWTDEYIICINWLNYSDEQLQRVFNVRKLIRHIYYKKLNAERSARWKAKRQHKTERARREALEAKIEKARAEGKEPKWLYRLEALDWDNGLWYNSSNELIWGIGKIPDCKTKDLPMDYDARYHKDGLNWFSSCSREEDLAHWYSLEDAKRLIENGFVFTKYLAIDYVEYDQETTFLKETALQRVVLNIEDIWKS